MNLFAFTLSVVMAAGLAIAAVGCLLTREFGWMVVWLEYAGLFCVAALAWSMRCYWDSRSMRRQLREKLRAALGALGPVARDSAALRKLCREMFVYNHALGAFEWKGEAFVAAIEAGQCRLTYFPNPLYSAGRVFEGLWRRARGLPPPSPDRMVVEEFELA